MIPRWGHAAVFLPSPPTLLIQGGKTDPSSSYTYSSAPNVNDVILLPLNGSFETSSPPLSLLPASTSAPSYAWHCLSSLSDAQILSFGGDGGTTEAIETSTDSSWVFNVNVNDQSGTFTHESSDWGNQPMRRIHHSCSTNGGRTIITGGEKDDGSATSFADVYSFDAPSSSFSALPSLPRGLYHHTSLLLSNGTLLVLGGVYTDPSTGTASLLPLSTLYTLDTTASSSSWNQATLGGTPPTGRRGATAALNSEGSKAFVFGGADATLSNVLGDGWVLDLQNPAWSQVTDGSSGAGARFDHTAVAVGNDQVILFGGEYNFSVNISLYLADTLEGYGTSAPVDSSIWIWDTATNAWASDYTVAEPLRGSSSVVSSSLSLTTTSTVSATAETGTTLPNYSGSGSIGASSSGSASVKEVVTTDKSGNTVTETAISGSIGSAPSSTTTSDPNAPSEAGDHSHLLPRAAMLGLIIGLVVLAALVICGVIYRNRQRKRRLALLATSDGYGGLGGGGKRPYGDREKAGEGLLAASADHEPVESPTSPAWHGDGSGLPTAQPSGIGLGMGVIGASLASIGRELQSRNIADKYAVLDNEKATPSLASAPSRRSLLRKSTRRVGEGIRLVRGPRPTSQMTPPLDSRIDMLRDEDSRKFRASATNEDWVAPDDESERHWKSAGSLLGSEAEAEAEADPFMDRDVLTLPPIHGGPVPTPRASVSYLDPFEDFGRQSGGRSPGSEADLDLDALLPPPPKRYSAVSSRSRQSTLNSDAEEGIIHHAQLGTMISPSTEEPHTQYLPIRRSESFLHRMTGGLLGAHGDRSSTSSSRRNLDVVDPNPLPGLWPMVSRDEMQTVQEASGSYPPTSFKATTTVTASTATTTLTHLKGPSLSSMTSARSMRDMVIIQREQTDVSEISTEIRETSPELDESRDVQTENADGTGGGRHTRYGRGATFVTQGTETPGSIVFNGADFATPPAFPTPTPAPQPQPSPSTLLDPLLSHRRPVRDVVESINKRGAGTPVPLNLFSPVSAYSPISPSSTGEASERRPKTMYEVAKRSPLKVANPDWRKRGSGNSD
ncbi:hypothetical protein P7C73_g5954, partial [Tremellales sp. Uapishka_1]